MPRPTDQPTGHKLAPTTLQAVLNRIDGGLNNSQIERETGVMRRHVARFRRNIQYWGQPYPPECVKLGRPRRLRQVHRTKMLEYLNGRPQAYLEELRDWLYDEYDLAVSLLTIHNELKRAKWSRKVATKRAAEQSDALRRVFQARVQINYTSKQIIAIDESACNERTGDRKYGWSPIGRSVELEYSMRRSERWSLLPAMTVDGYFAHTVFQGDITSAILEDFLEFKVLPLCTAGYYVLLMDNASVY